MADMAAEEVLQAQLDEIAALCATYPDLVTFEEAEELNVKFAQRVASGQTSAATAADVPALSGTLQLPGVELAGAPVHLAFVLPKHGGAVGLNVRSNAPRHEADELQQVASTTADDCRDQGMPCLLMAADSVTQAALQLAEAAAAEQQRAGLAPSAAACTQATPQQQQRQRQLVLSRRCVWFHHIKSLQKRKHILEWAGDLRLGGFSKPGFPGVVIVEGDGCGMDEYLSRLRRLRWQAMAVRGEEDVPLSSAEEVEAMRLLPCRMQELGEEEMGRLGQACRQAGLEELFLTALKLHPAR